MYCCWNLISLSRILCKMNLKVVAVLLLLVVLFLVNDVASSGSPCLCPALKQLTGAAPPGCVKKLKCGTSTSKPCGKGMVCCSTACGGAVCKPRVSPKLVHSGQCPAHTGFGSCIEACGAPEQASCASEGLGQICCGNGCGHTCQCPAKTTTVFVESPASGWWHRLNQGVFIMELFRKKLWNFSETNVYGLYVDMAWSCSGRL